MRAAPRRARFGAQPTRSGGTWRGDGPFDGFPHSRSITRPQATDFAQQNRPLQKENTILTDGVFFLERATRLDSLPASHEWQSHSQEPCRTS